MIVTCPCRSCSEPVEFTHDQTGQTVDCPHCGDATLLYIATRRAPSKAGLSIQAKWLIAVGVLLFLILLAAGAFGFLNKLVLYTGTVAGAVVALLFAVLIFIWAILWIVFPVFVYFGMVRIEKLLQKIEQNTRK